MNTIKKAEWLKKRTLCITGTDIGAILGLNPYKTAFEVWMSKTSEQPELADNAAMSWGRRLEPVIAEVYTEQTGIPLKHGEFICKEISGIPCGGTPDYTAADRELVLEIKTARSGNGWGDSGTDEIPIQYLSQVVWYMGILQYEIAHVAVLIGASDFRTYTLEWQPDLWQGMLEQAGDFWQLVKSGTPPDIDGSGGAREWIKNTFKGGNGIIEEPAADLNFAASELRYWQKMEKVAKEGKDKWTNRTLELIGDHDKAIFDFGSVTVVRPRSSLKTDWKECIEAAKITIPQEIIDANSIESDPKPYIKATFKKDEE